jgi:dolichyl-phosphate-mannose-protein mannosyltransferase
VKNPTEEKTTELPGAQRAEDVPVAFSADDKLKETTAEVADDTRAPLGRDAGAPEATMADAIGGGAGWQGGAEDGPGLPRAEVEDAPVPNEQTLVPEIPIDDETEDLVKQALELDKEDARRAVEGL